MIKRYTRKEADKFLSLCEKKSKSSEYLRQLLVETFKDKDEIALFAYIVLSSYFSRDFKEIHYKHLEFLKIGVKEKPHRATKAYRGEGKTSIQIVLQNIYDITHDVYQYIVINSYNDSMGIDKIKLIKDEFEDNQVLRWLYGEPIQQKDYWNKSDLEIYGKCRVKNISTGQSPRGLIDRGQRPQKILSDDILNDEDVRSEELRNKALKWYKEALMPALAPNGVMELLNTPLHPEDIIETVFSEEPPFHYNWETLLITGEGEDGRSVDEGWKTTDELMELKKDEYTYSQEIMCNPLQVSSGMIKWEDLRFYDLLPVRNGKDKCIYNFFMHADTTHTAKTTSDYFCLVVAGQDVFSKKIYIMDYFIEKISVETQARKYIEYYIRYSKDYKCTKATYDEKANQGFGYWIKKMAREEYNVSLPISELGYPNDKVTHFQPHVPHFKSNRVYFPENNACKKIAYDQLLAFPQKGIHDDFVDGISGVLDNFKYDMHLIKENLTEQATRGLIDYEEF